MDKYDHNPEPSAEDNPAAGAGSDWLERLRRELNQAQFQFATADSAMILGLAGPGSGKTRALVYRAAHLVLSGVAPEKILLLTFTNKAAEEMKERLKVLLGFWPQGLWAGTFHSIGARILRRHAAAVGRQANFTILDDDDSKNLLKQIAAGLVPRLDEDDHKLLIRRGLLGRLISQSRNSDLSIRQVMEEYYPYRLELLDLVEEMSTTYERQKAEANAFDFDDLLLCWLDIFKQHYEIAESYRARFTHVLVDEYQDTNIVQARVVDQFAGGSICVVGDDAQSIYAFRYAHVGNILSFPDRHPGCLMVRMEHNYRSTPEIVALADASISFNPEQLPKKLFTMNEPGDKPWVIGARSARTEAAFVGRQVTELNREGLPLSGIAVLYRSTYLSTEVEFALNRLGLPYRTYGGIKFLQRGHIKDLLAHMKVLYNPFDETAWRRIATLQPGIGPSSFDKAWSALKRNSDPLEAALAGQGVPSRGKEGWLNLCRTLESARMQESVPSMIAAIMDGGYEEILGRSYPDQVEERMRGIERLAFYSEQFETLSAFLESLVLEESLFTDTADDSERSAEMMTLSTIHSAKGKEWDAVFVIGMNEGHFPSRRGDERNLSEERRLFYVAATRARRFLYLSTYREEYRGWGAATEGPSLFLRELPPDCYEPVLLDDDHY